MQSRAAASVQKCGSVEMETEPRFFSDLLQIRAAERVDKADRGRILLFHGLLIREAFIEYRQAGKVIPVFTTDQECAGQVVRVSSRKFLSPAAFKVRQPLVALRIVEILVTNRKVGLGTPCVLRVGCHAPPINSWTGSAGWSAALGAGSCVEPGSETVVAIYLECPLCVWRVPNHGIGYLLPVVKRLSAKPECVGYRTRKIVFGCGPFRIRRVRHAGTVRQPGARAKRRIVIDDGVVPAVDEIASDGPLGIKRLLHVGSEVEERNRVVE